MLVIVGIIAGLIYEYNRIKAERENPTLREPQKLGWPVIIVAIVLGLAIFIGSYLWSRYGPKSPPGNRPDPIIVR